MNIRPLIIITSLAILAGACSSPEIEVTRNDMPFAQIVKVKSTSKSNIFVRRIVVNNNDGNENCERAVGHQLQPGDETMITFVGCGKVMEITVYTDKGVWDGTVVSTS